MVVQIRDVVAEGVEEVFGVIRTYFDDVTERNELLEDVWVVERFRLVQVRVHAPSSSFEVMELLDFFLEMNRARHFT